MKSITVPCKQHGFVTINQETGVAYKSDAQGAFIRDEEGFVTFVNVNLD